MGNWSEVKQGSDTAMRSSRSQVSASAQGQEVRGVEQPAVGAVQP